MVSLRVGSAPITRRASAAIKGDPSDSKNSRPFSQLMSGRDVDCSFGNVYLQAGDPDVGTLNRFLWIAGSSVY